MRLLLVIHSLRCGGAERVLSTLANAWVARGHDITLVTLADEPVFYALAASVHVQPLGLSGGSQTFAAALRANFRRMAGLRKRLIATRPDVLISFMDSSNVLAILASIGTGVPTIVCEHTDPSQSVIGRVWSTLRFLTYPSANAVTFLTENVFQRWRWLRNACVMPNPVVIGESFSRVSPHWPKGKRRVLAVGRLAAVKGYDRLLSAFHQLVQRCPEWSLTILGEGSARPQLEQQVRELDLANRVSMPGNVQNPFDWMAEADFLVMSSRHEGFPCVLGEAMACGLPVVSFDCNSGPRDIIRHGVDGLLVPQGDVAALAGAMERLMSDESERARFAARAPEVMDRYNLESVLCRWDDLFARVCGTRAPIAYEAK